MINYLSHRWYPNDRNWRYLVFIDDYIKSLGGSFYLIDIGKQEQKNTNWYNIFALRLPSVEDKMVFDNYVGNRSNLLWEKIDNEDIDLIINNLQDSNQHYKPQHINPSFGEYLKFEARMNRYINLNNLNISIDTLNISEQVRENLLGKKCQTIGDIFQNKIFESLSLREQQDVKLQLSLNGFYDSIQPKISPFNSDSPYIEQITGHLPSINISGRKPTLFDFEQTLINHFNSSVDQLILGSYFELRVIKQNKWAIIYSYNYKGDKNIPEVYVAGNIGILEKIAYELTKLTGPLIMDNKVIF